MAKSKKRPVATVGESMADRATKNMTYKDLQRACIARGMPFEEVLNSSVLQLHSWFGQNFGNGQDLGLINLFDDYVDEQLTSIGRTNPNKSDYVDPNHPLKHASLKLGFIAKRDEDGNVLEKKKPRLKGKGLDTPVKKKKERVEGTKVFSHTKKGLTYKGASKGIEFERVWKKVKKEYPDANEKSVKIWYTRALKELKNKK